MQKIVPIPLKWKMAPDSDISLHVTVTEVDWVAFAEYIGKDGQGKENVGIRIEFPGTFATRTHPHCESKNMIDGRFDMTLETREMLSLAPVNYGRLLDQTIKWRETGICPDSRVFRVLDSEWIAELGISSCEHFLIAGGEATVEVIADAFIVQPIPFSEMTRMPPVTRRSPPA